MDVDELLVLFLHDETWEEEPTQPYHDPPPASEPGTTYCYVREERKT